MKIKFFTILVVFCFITNVYPNNLKEQENIARKARINEIAIEIARCQGIIKADQEAYGKPYTGILSKSYSGGKWLLSFIKTKELDSIEDKTYRGTKLLLEAGNKKAISEFIGECIIKGIIRHSTLLRLLKKSSFIKK